MGKTLKILLPVFIFFCTVAGGWADVQITLNGSTGLALEGLKGYLGGSDLKERILIRSDEPQAYIMFFWDSKDLEITLTLRDKSGKIVTEMNLVKGNILTISKPGNYECTLTAKKGSGHWLCVLLGSREWDP